MSDFFDSSWLIATLVEDEKNHSLCWHELAQALAGEAAWAAQHSLAEVFHTVTGKKGVPPQQAAELLHHNFDQLRWLPITKQDYWDCLDSAYRYGARGGAIFDLLLLQTAERHGATRIHTLNKRHFLALGPQLRNKIVGPED